MMAPQFQEFIGSQYRLYLILGLKFRGFSIIFDKPPLSSFIFVKPLYLRLFSRNPRNFSPKKG